MKSSRHSFQILITPEFSRENFEKHSNTKFHENLSNGSRVVLCGRTVKRTDGQTGTAKLILAPKKLG